MTNLSDYVTSLIRTAVPVAVGALAAWLSSKIGFVVDEQTQAGLIAGFTGLAVGLYYALIRWLETKVPQFGWLLGVARKPIYVPEDETPPQNPVDYAGPPRGPPQ